MPLDASQVINNIKRSYNSFVASKVGEANVNYDDSSFDTSEMVSWYSIRYAGYSSEPTGMGDFIEENTNQEGRLHILQVELGAWCRNDPQRIALGDMIDIMIDLSETSSVTFYDYSDLEIPSSDGTFKQRPKVGGLTPSWGGRGGSGSKVPKSDGHTHTGSDMVGFVMLCELRLVAEVG